MNNIFFKKNVERKCPFKVGDKLKFKPTSRTKGWNISFDHNRIYPGYIGLVTRIENGVYIYLDDNRGGFHWIDYRFADEKSWYGRLFGK